MSRNPAIENNPRSAVVAVRVTESMRNALDIKAAKMHLKFPDVVRLALAEWVSDISIDEIAILLANGDTTDD